jgi:hypothetical protein
MLTQPRQARLVKCAILAPGLEQRGQVKEDKAELATYGFDITPFVQKIDIYESIFDNTISGSIAILENVGLTEYLPIVGVEVLALVFEVDAADGTHTFARAFRVVGIKDQTFPRHDWRLYTIQLVTNEFVKSISNRICRRFGKTCEDAVKDIMKTDLGLLDASKPGQPQLLADDPTFGLVDIVIPNYSPLQAINYFTMLSQTVDAPHESNFLFFETLDGFHFTSIAKLIKNGVPNATGINKLGKPVKVFDVAAGQVSTAPTVDVDTMMNAINRIHQIQSFDLLFDIAAGTLRSRMVSFDFVARTVSKDKEGDSRYTDSFGQTTHLDKFPVYPHNFDLTVSNNVRLFTFPTNLQSTQSPYIKANDPMSEQRLHEAVVLRNRQIREIQHLQNLLELPGQPDLRAGSVVVVNYPSTMVLEDKTDETINSSRQSNPTPFYSGPHLVTSVHHIITTKGTGSWDYRMNVKVCKDSLGHALYGTSNTKGL